MQATQSSAQQVLSCALCGGGDPSDQCFMLCGSQEEINYMESQNWKGNFGNPPYNNALIKVGGTTTTMVGSKMSVHPVDHHLMVIKLNKVDNINLFIKTILLSWRILSINPCKSLSPTKRIQLLL